MAASMKMALEAQGMETDEDTVNRVMGAKPMQGASWEQALACAQHFGMRATLITPCPMSTLKEWTDRGVAVMIAWNPEGREWSHASVVFDVDGKTVSVADPNIPDPEQTVREVPRDEFLKKWFEKWPNYLVRRPALAIEREITKDGRQVMASTASVSRIAARYLEARVEIRTFDTGDWHAYSGAEAFEDGEPLIADINSIENGYGGFRVRGDVFTSVTFTVDAQGGQAHFSNAKGHEAIAIDHKNIRFQRDGKKFLKYTLDTFHATGTLPPMYKFV
jgi:hypothetical protein